MTKRERKYIPRRTLDYQMNRQSQIDLEVIAIYESAVKERRAHQMFRDAMRLFHALESGDVELLFSMFPKIREKFQLQAQETAIMGRLDALEQLWLSGNLKINLPPVDSRPEPLLTGKTLAGANKISAPVYDDEDDTPLVVKKDMNADSASGLNFLDAAFGMKHMEAQRDNGN